MYQYASMLKYYNVLAYFNYYMLLKLGFKKQKKGCMGAVTKRPYHK